MHGPHLLGQGDARVQIAPGQPDQSVGIQTLGERVHRFHRPEARAPHDDPDRPSLAEQIDRVRQVFPAAVARLTARAAEPATRTHAPPVVGQDQVPPVGEQGREPEPLGLVAGSHVPEHHPHVTRTEHAPVQPHPTRSPESHRLRHRERLGLTERREGGGDLRRWGDRRRWARSGPRRFRAARQGQRRARRRGDRSRSHLSERYDCAPRWVFASPIRPLRSSSPRSRRAYAGEGTIRTSSSRSEPPDTAMARTTPMPFA